MISFRIPRHARVALGFFVVALLGCSEKSRDAASDRAGSASSKRVLVLGIDGMDPQITSRLMAEGKLPNCAALAARGAYRPLATSMPPQSPVAWSNFISGADPGTHQIYDFVHRRVKLSAEKQAAGIVVEPFLSTSEVVPDVRWYSRFSPGAAPIPFTNWQLPLESQKNVSLRRGPAFWDYLVTAGVETTIYRMPANYPPPVAVLDTSVEGGWLRFRSLPFRCLCGMGTPDITGSYGVFTSFTEDMVEDYKDVPGGRFVRLDVRDHRALTRLEGPPSPLRRPVDGRSAQPPFEGEFHPPTFAEIEIVRDAVEETALIRVNDSRIVLKKGEWSDWIPIELRPDLRGESIVSSLGLAARIPAMARIHVREVHPNLDLYFSPLNIDPLRQAQPIAAPAAFAAEIASKSGRYYTQGIPEDTKALREGALTEDEYLQMVRLLSEERTRQYHDALAAFRDGFLFFYFGSVDQLSHIFWRDIDPQHPGRKKAQEGRYATVIEDVYREMDLRVGEALANIGSDDVLLVVSDHGFSSFRRGVILNRWLQRNGYLAELPDQSRLALRYVDWTKTRAYAMGINSIYLNQRGRESQGIVADDERQALIDEISAKLLELRDVDGVAAVVKVYDTFKEYPGADPDIAPDILVGYAHNYRGAWANVEGDIRRDVFENNVDRWSGDHCIAAFQVPGVLFANRQITLDDPTLCDVAPTILSQYGISAPPAMTGRPFLASPK